MIDSRTDLLDVVDLILDLVGFDAQMTPPVFACSLEFGASSDLKAMQIDTTISGPTSKGTFWEPREDL